MPNNISYVNNNDWLDLKIQSEAELEQHAADELNKILISNAEYISDLKIAQIKKEKVARLEVEKEVYKFAVKRNYDTSLIEKYYSNKTALEKEKQEKQYSKKKEKELTKKSKKALKDYVSETAAKNAATLKNWDKLDKAEQAKEVKKEEKKLKRQLKSVKLVEKAQLQADARATRDEEKAYAKQLSNIAFGKGSTLKERANATKQLISNPTAFVNAISDLAKQLENQIDAIGKNKSIIDTALQGSKNSTFMGSYWDRMSKDVTKVAGISPLVKQADIVENIKSMASDGIAYNLEQRAFLATISDRIAATFNATDSTLLQLVRIQQEDTTASRLGMESALTSFLNNMYETSEYMKQQAASIRASLYEASALMTAKSATEFEYQVQKWMGSLYSVGFSNTSGLSGALGKLAAGDISSINNGGYGNLLVMAANNANMSVADILKNGLNSSETNSLMASMVDYLAGIYNETKGSKILAQQYAGVFGLTASDLKAAANLSESLDNISDNNLDNSGMLSQLTNMANSMYMRTSMGELLNNVWENFKYTTAAGVANNPILYALTKVATLLDNTVGGIPIPMISVMGNTVDLHTTVADLMKTGALAGGFLSGIGQMVTGLAKGGSFSGSGMLKLMGVESSTHVSRGTGANLLTTSGMTVSEGGYIGNGSGLDVQKKTTTDATDSSKQQLAEAQDESEDITMGDVNESILQIYNLLLDVVNGTKALTVTSESQTSFTGIGTENSFLNVSF